MPLSAECERHSPHQLLLIDAAIRLLDEVGIAEFTMRGLGLKLGQSPMAAYKHFSNQRDLQLQLWGACQQRFFKTILENTTGPDSATAFLALCRTFMVYAVEYPYRYEFLYSHPFARGAEVEPELAELSRSVWTYAHDLVRQAQRERTFRSDVSSEVVLAVATSQARGLASTMIFAAPTPFRTLSPEIMIESGLAFIRAAILPR